MKKSQKTRGAISVFLVLILVPCLFITTIFTDVGRMYMSKTMAESSADLALNSLMTNYDSDLNEWYGLVASCQNIDEFYEVSAKFFLRTLSSQNLSDDELKLLTDYYSSTTGDDTIHDLLRVQCESETKDMVKAVEGADLSNPTLMKKQVVEFMKYRAPIELTVNLIDRIQKNEDAVKAAIDAEKNKPVVDAKKEFYEAEGELLEAAFNTYCQLMLYYESTEKLGLNNDKLKDYQTQINSYEDVYRDINKWLISNLYNTTGFKQYYRVTKGINSYSYRKEDVCSRKEIEEIEKKDENGNTYTETITHYYISGSQIDSLLASLDSEISAFETALGNFEIAAQSLVDKMPGQGSDTNEIQWWVQMNEAVNSSKPRATNYTEEVSTKADAMLDAYAKVLAINSCELDNDVPSNWKSQNRSGLCYNNLVAKVKTLRETYLKSSVKENDEKSYNIYLKAVNKLEEVSKNNIDNIKSKNLYVDILVDEVTTTMNLDDALSHMATELSAIASEMDTHSEYLKVVINGGTGGNGSKVKSLDKLRELARKYNEALGKWESAANGAVSIVDGKLTKMAQADLDDIKKIKETGGSSDEMVVAEAISEEAVIELKTRLENIRGQLGEVKDAIDGNKGRGVTGITYASTSVTQISDISTMKSKLGIKETVKIPLTNREIESKANEIFNRWYEPNPKRDDGENLTLEHMDDYKYNISINPDMENVVQTPALFVHLHKQFQGKTAEDVELNTSKQEMKDATERGNALIDGIKEATERYNCGCENSCTCPTITKEYSGDESYSIGDSISGIIGLFKDILGLIYGKAPGKQLRDNLYATTYIMEMFSYGTYENQGYYWLMKDKEADVTVLDIGNYSDKYKEYKETWESKKPKDHFNKSLRNKLINKTNNKAYQAEVEYMLYGKTGTGANAKNVCAAYSDIFGIRYILNTVSGFEHFWDRDATTTAGTIDFVSGTISQATHFIIPAGLVKTVMILLLTAFETISDLNRLEAGFPVEIYKVYNKNECSGNKCKDWWCSMGSSGDGTSIDDPTETSGKKNTGKGLFYSDYLTIFVYLALSSDTMEETMYKRMAEVMQNNIGHIGDVEGYSLTKSKVYFTIDAKLRVEPLMMALPLFQEYTDGIDLEGDWCTYTIDTTRGYS